MCTKPYDIFEPWDVIVVGAGHAGCEAALAAARMGARTLILTMNPDTIGQMSCNPAIGGLGKGQLVREIDALGGEMALNIDATGIQFRMLNTRKGPAVRSPRAQADKKAYQFRMKYTLESAKNLSIRQEMVEDVRVENGVATGVVGRSGILYKGKAVILTTGTFLSALMHTGEHQERGGRSAEPSAEGLSDTLRRAGFELGRLKTGTPPRVHGMTVDHDKCERQPGDDVPAPFSYLNDQINNPQIDCWITWTNEETHKILRDNLERSPMYSGQIDAVGPRYCPSIEDKVVRFADKDSHQIFLEPEGHETWEYYCNGISTSTPVDVQEAMIRTIPGMEKAEILRYGYAVEYDFAPPHALLPTLETRLVKNLFHAGQINGTSGYEEAGAQGLLAGLNAVRNIRGESPVKFDRSEAYIGVMVDDLVTQEHVEPYRMFTSRAEHRLHLRSDNADLRLTPLGREFGLVDDDRWARFEEKRDTLDRILTYLKQTKTEATPLEQILRNPDVSIRDLAKDHRVIAAALFSCPAAVEQAEIQCKYEGYITRQQQEIEKFKRLETLPMPEHIDYTEIPHLRNEAQRRLSEVRPVSLGQASRVAGVTPSDISVLMVYLKR